MAANVRRLITTILQMFFVLIFLFYLILNTIIDVARSKLVYTTQTFDTATALPPPAFTLCSDDVKYKFQCTSYGNTTSDCPGFVTNVDVSKDETYNNWFTNCYVFQTTTPLLKQTPPTPPRNWTAFQSPFYIRYQLNNASTISKMNLMIWNPYDLTRTNSDSNSLSSLQILNPYETSQLDACRERVYSFYWRKHVFLNGTEKWDVDWRAEVGVSSNAFGNNSTAVGVIHFKPGSFEVPTTREYTSLPFISILTGFLVLLAALYSTYYAMVGGRGKYRTWGCIHMITRYFPQQHLTPSEDGQERPTADNILWAYLDGLDKAEFEKK
ncbi:10679_t:CDS:2 [Ambispora gerdemannii]|uniref:10679_t:CDS:1 n=1 Tax=Ambispora gerdemannii TaxID=144530 RepID=A0A9N8YX92_9GLOM|nr:10679_t:CDS:2 [Ambispora gerdemannii]